MLTFGRYRVELQVILDKLLVFADSKAEFSDHIIDRVPLGVVVKLVVRKGDLLERLGNCGPLQHRANSFILQLVAREVDFLDGRPGVNQDFKKGICTLLINRAVGEGQVFEGGVHCDALRQIDDTLRAKMVVV